MNEVQRAYLVGLSDALEIVRKSKVAGNTIDRAELIIENRYMEAKREYKYGNTTAENS